MATQFNWTAPQNLEHAVTFAAWGPGLLVPSALSPTVYAYTFGASGLVSQPVPVASGMSGGFAGCVSDAFGGVWLVGYDGNVTYLNSIGSGTVYPALGATSGDVFLGAAMHGSNPYFVADTGDLLTVAAGALTPVTPGFGQQVSSLSADATSLYAVLPQSSNLATYTFSGPTSGSVSTMAVPMDVPAFVVASGAGLVVGGYSNSVLPYGATMFETSPFSKTASAAVDTAANKIYLFSGTEPDWQLSSAVSGTGSPVALAWASSGEQVLVADTVHNQVQVFNIVANVLVPYQTVAVSGVVDIVTADGLTALAMQPSSNQVSVLKNIANQWSVTSTVPVTGASTALGLTSSTYVVGGTDKLSWLQAANQGWIVISSVSGLAVTPSNLATDAVGNILVTGTSAVSGAGYLMVANSQQVLASTHWSGTADAVLYEQAQIAVADSANSLLRVFAYQGGNLVQQTTFDGPTGVRDIDTTFPSLWACGASGIWQLVFGQPFTIERRREGILAIYNGSTWVSGATGVGGQPTAAAWDVSGTVWVATQNDILNRFSRSAVAVSGIPLTPYLGNSTVPIGISSLHWINGGLFAVSSLNAALMGVSGAAVSGTPGVVAGVLLGINFILGDSFYQ